PGWAARPHTERSAILRRAAEAWLANAPEIEHWGIREGGKVPPAMQFETHIATGETFEAATLPSRPHGELVPSGQPRPRLGRRVGELAGRLLMRVHLEVGGNSALVIMDDADLDLAAPAGAWGSFLHQGQICMTTGRHLVHESVYDDYVARLAGKAAALPVGNPATGQVALGPVIDKRQRDKIHSLVTGSLDTGATLAAGGSYEEL